MSNSEEVKDKLLKLSKLRARNSTIAYFHQSDIGVHEGRVRADKEWGVQQQELAKTLPEGDGTRDIIEFIGHLDQNSPPRHLISRLPQKSGVTLGDMWPKPKE